MRAHSPALKTSSALEGPFNDVAAPEVQVPNLAGLVFLLLAGPRRNSVFCSSNSPQWGHVGPQLEPIWQQKMLDEPPDVQRASPMGQEKPQVPLLHDATPKTGTVQA